MMKNNSAIVVASLIDQTKTRLEVVLEYISQNKDLITDSTITSKIADLRQTMFQLESMITR